MQEFTCYWCRRKGHLASNCPARAAGKAKVTNMGGNPGKPVVEKSHAKISGKEDDRVSKLEATVATLVNVLTQMQKNE